VESNKLLEKIMTVMEDKKAKDIMSIDITSLSIISDYFAICSGTSTTHIKAICDELEFKLEEQGIKCFHIEGYETARWILMDYSDVIVHIFHDEDRQFYNLERLWSHGIKNYKESVR
jgi:ribosome-associated protein